jgi:hypothetical protein
MFLGYKNRDTKVKVTCNRLDPAYDRILGTYDLGVFDVKEFGTVIPFNIPDQNYSNKLDIYLAIKRDMLDIEVTDSGKFMGMFKSYGPSRVLNIDFRIVPK